MYTTTSSIPDHAPMLAYCHVGSMMSRFSMIDTRRAMAARQPLSRDYVSLWNDREVKVIAEYLQSSQAKQAHDKYLLSLLHLQSPDLDSRKGNNCHVLYDTYYRAHATGIGFRHAISWLDVFVP